MLINKRITLSLLAASVVVLGVSVSFLLAWPSVIDITGLAPKDQKDQGLEVPENRSSALPGSNQPTNQTVAAKAECKCPSAPMSIILREGFEYEDSITNHGWVAIDPASNERIQSNVVAEGGRAVELHRLQGQAYLTDLYIYRRSFTPLREDFQIDFYIRSSSHDQQVGVLLKVDGKGIFTGFQDSGRYFRVHHDNLVTAFPRYELDQWYHIRLMVMIGQGRLDVYINNMSAPVVSNLYFSDSYFDTISLQASSGSGAVSYFDGIIIRGYRD